MTPPLQQLATVLELATRRRDQALQALVQAQQEHEQAQAQMNQIKGYSAESLQRWSLRASQGITPSLLRTHQTFMAKLEHAVSFQDGVLARISENIQHRKGQLLDAERELASLQKVQQRRIEDWQKVRQRQEQRNTDEMAANQHRRHAQAHPWRSQP